MKLISVFIFLLFHCIGFGQVRPNLVHFIQPIELAGKIKSITVERHYRLEHKKDARFHFNYKYQYFYDSLGVKTGHKNWNYNGDLQGSAEYVYDSLYTTLLGVKLTDSLEKQNLNQCCLLEEWHSDFACFYLDKTGDRIANIVEFDSTGIKRRERWFGADTSTVQRMYLYDSYGNRTYKEEIFKESKGLVSYTENCEYTYDERGNILKKDDTTYGTIRNYTYDKLNRLLSDEYVSSNSIDYKVYQYNAHNDITLITVSNGADSTMKYQHKIIYKYDARGNWISKVTYENDLDFVKETRAIEYY